jgi:hypothetical protein
MADSDRPDLGLQVDGEIETKQIAVDATHWEQLRELQVFMYADAAFLGSKGLPPAKRPIRLRAILASYASALFNVEASEYPRTPRLKHWLAKLAHRTRLRVTGAVAQLESGAQLNLSSIAYHNVTIWEMNETIDSALRPLIENYLHKTAVIDSPSETIAHQLQRLREECRWTIEDLAAATGMSTRTVARHLSGVGIPYPKNIFAYERAFFKRLKKQVVINKMS